MWQYSNYSKISPVAERHFPFKSPRTDQLETISEIIDAISRGYKYIVLEAGTGTGKSDGNGHEKALEEAGGHLCIDKDVISFT